MEIVIGSLIGKRLGMGRKEIAVSLPAATCAPLQSALSRQLANFFKPVRFYKARSRHQPSINFCSSWILLNAINYN